MSCLLIYTHWQRSTEASRDGALYPAIFFFPPLVSPPSVVLSLPSPAFSPFTELDLTKELPLSSFLISNKTLVWRGSYSHMILWHTEGLFPCAKTQIHKRMSKRHLRYLTMLYFISRVIKQLAELITAISTPVCEMCTLLSKRRCVHALIHICEYV